MELVVLAHQRLQQTLAISPAVVAFAELLCLPLPELAQVIEREVEQNPALDPIAASPTDALPLDWAAKVADEPTDAARLLADVRLALSEAEHPLVEVVVASLDERGFLTANVSELASWSGADPGRVECVLEAVRSTGPAGVAASDLRECLLLQLDRTESVHPLARDIVADHLEDLAAGRFCSIAQVLGVDRDDVLAARDFIRARLRPAPDYSGSAKSPRQLLVDVVVDEQLQVTLTEPSRFGVRVAPLYSELAARGSPAERRHARAQLRRALEFTRRLEHRWATTQAVAQETIARQSSFVRGDAHHPLPLTRAEVAHSVGVHESTVGRATRDRHARLPDGRVVAMSELFNATAASAREALRELLANEPGPPSTDAELVSALAVRGYTVARRTVAKYRAELGVARCALR